MVHPDIFSDDSLLERKVNLSLLKLWFLCFILDGTNFAPLNRKCHSHLHHSWGRIVRKSGSHVWNGDWWAFPQKHLFIIEKTCMFVLCTTFTDIYCVSSKRVLSQTIKRIFYSISRVKYFGIIKCFLNLNKLLWGGKGKERFIISISIQGRYLRAIVSLTDN